MNRSPEELLRLVYRRARSHRRRTWVLRGSGAAVVVVTFVSLAVVARGAGSPVTKVTTRSLAQPPSPTAGGPGGPGGPSTPGVAGPTPTVATPTPPPTTTAGHLSPPATPVTVVSPPPVVVACTAADVHIRDKTQQSTGGYGLAQFLITNPSSRPCAIGGFPVVAEQDSHGQPLPTAESHRTPLASSARQQPVTLLPFGGTAGFDVTWPQYRGAGSCPTNAPPPVAASLLVTWPNQSQGQPVMTTLPLQACGGAVAVSYVYPAPA
jgi:hypothetical protein